MSDTTDETVEDFTQRVWSVGAVLRSKGTSMPDPHDPMPGHNVPGECPECGDTLDRSLSVIAAEVRQDWRDKNGRPNVNFAAKPYLEAMECLDSIEDPYYADSGREIVMRFVGNASSWRGPVAQRVKAELRGMLGR